MAPEVLRGCAYSEKADVYSFGISLVELYTSKTPYDDDRFRKVNKMELLSMICNGTRPDVSSLPDSLRLLVEDCWDTDAALRPSFGEIILRLKRLKRLHVGSTSTSTFADVTTEDLSDFLTSESSNTNTHDNDVEYITIDGAETADGSDIGDGGTGGRPHHHTDYHQMRNVTEEVRVVTM
jgi:hypothetical protein